MFSSKFPMFIAWGPQLVFLYNDAYAEILGDKHPAAAGARFEDVWREIWPDVAPNVALALAGTSNYHENARLMVYRHGRLQEAWFNYSYSPLLGTDNEVCGMFCTCAETTGQVLAARHRSEENHRLRELFQNAPGVIAHMVGKDHVFDLANDAFLHLTGKTGIVGMTVREALPELAGQGFFELLDQVYASGEAYLAKAAPVRLRRRDGQALEQRHVDFIYQPVFDHQHQVTGIFMEGSDVTESVLAQERARQSEARLRELANTILQLAWMAEADGVVHWYNDRWYEYSGLTRDGMAAPHWTCLIHPEEAAQTQDQWRQSVASGALFEAKARLRAADGAYNTFMIRAAPLRDDAGRVLRWFGTGTDVTPLQQAQSELKAASVRKDEFLAMLAHELRNPLAPIATAAELLKLAVPDPQSLQRTSAIITRQVAHMKQLLDDLLDVSRVTRGQVTLHSDIQDIGAIVRESVEQAQGHCDQRRQQLHVRLDGDSLLVFGDRTRLIQIFTNLLDNASKFTAAGGEIGLTVSATGDTVTVEVRDTGMGIAPTLLPYVFDLFTQGERSPDRSQGGLGLGLSLVRSLVELQSGAVTAHSDGVGRGSSFRVSLPRIDSPVTPANEVDAPAAPGSEPASSVKSVLVVDDNVDAADTMGMLLESIGYTVAVAHSSADALVKAAHHAPAIMFLDIGLPGMDGYALAKAIRDLPSGADAVLVALTGYGQPEDVQRALGGGFNHHLAKPARLSRVLEILDGAAVRPGGGA